MSAILTEDDVRDIMRDAIVKIAELRQERDAARKALRQIATLRPAGDVERCANARKLVEQMEGIAIGALPTWERVG